MVPSPHSVMLEPVAPFPGVRRGAGLPEIAGPAGEREARAELRAQIGRLEHSLAQAFAAAFPRAGIDVSVGRSGGPRLLGLAELERLRDELHERLCRTRQDLAARGMEEERNRVLLENMLLAPGRYKFVRIRNADLGLPGCGEWHVRPRLGLIGMLAGWWQVKLSSGCPLAMGRAHRASPRSSP